MSIELRAKKLTRLFIEFISEISEHMNVIECDMFEQDNLQITFSQMIKEQKIIDEYIEEFITIASCHDSFDIEQIRGIEKEYFQLYDKIERILGAKDD